jgi:3-dehydroquinate synthase
VSTRTVRVGLGGRAYDIAAGPGLLSKAGHMAAPFARTKRVHVVSEERVFALHGKQLTAGLQAAGLQIHETVLPPGEGSKSFAMLERLCDALLAARAERGDLILAFGGGVIGDLAGFAAGILKRGLDYVQIPTTLLAQVDSSVGGKTAINARSGKNLIGLFHQPRLVIADTSVLDTLPARELRAGFAEVVKYGLIADAEFYLWLRGNAQAILKDACDERTQAIVKCCEAKSRIVELDERENGVRALLNLGHTFGHALEAETGFGDKLLHGEAVAIGMAMALRLSERLGHCAQGAAAGVAAFLRSVGLPASMRDVTGLKASATDILRHMSHDKKVKDGRITLILARGIGAAFITSDISEADILAALEAETSA